MTGQIIKFGLIGALATGVHMLIGLVLIGSGCTPLIANALAFGTAFLTSFIGHLGFSFADRDTDLATAAWRFACVAVAGFLVNESLLIVVLEHSDIKGIWALCLSTFCAALLTFNLSKYWAFRRQKALPSAEGEPAV